MVRVFIDGREGTTGLQIEQRLAARGDVELLHIDAALRKDVSERARLLNDCDVAFLCLPDAAAIEAASLVANDRTVVIDASTAHRTAPGWAYGLPELSDRHRAAIAGGRRIAVPGCHASGFIALLYPLIAAGALPADYPLSAVSLTGYTGGGKSMIAEYGADDRDVAYDSPRQYAMGQSHKHLREMMGVCGLTRAPVFMPIVADFPRGMEVSVGLHRDLLRGGADPAAILAEHYADCSMVRVVEPGGDAFLPANVMAGRDDMILQVFGNDERALLVARFDNLGKGASGAAVQCMNIALGLPEQESLIGTDSPITSGGVDI